LKNSTDMAVSDSLRQIKMEEKMKYRAEYSEVCGYWVILNEEKNFAEGGYSEEEANQKSNELNARDEIGNLEQIKDLDVDEISEKDTYFSEWFKNEQARFHCGQLSYKQICHSAFMEGIYYQKQQRK